MGKKSLVYLLMVLSFLTCFSLYNKYVEKSTALSKSIDISKIDFIAFPIKENQAKLFPLVKQFSSSLPKSKTEENKEKSEQIKSIEKTPEIKKPLPEKTVVVNVPDVVLKIGDNGDAVKHIQHKLNEYGYKLEEDGLFSALTYDAILNFQYRCNLGIDGVVGSKTLEKLNIPPDKNVEFNTKITSVSNSKNSTSTIALNNYKSISELESSINSLKATSKTNYYIKVDLSNQRVNIFTKSEDKWVLDRSFICSTGKASTPTVKGDFTIKDKGPMFRAGSNTICNYYTQFYGNYLFHTVLLDNNENIQDGRLGTPLSHGCIRLAIDDAKYIYTSIPYGTSVSIQ